MFLCENIQSTIFIGSAGFGCAPGYRAVSVFHTHPEPLRRSGWLGSHSKNGKIKETHGKSKNSNVSIASKYLIIAIIRLTFKTEKVLPIIAKRTR